MALLAFNGLRISEIVALDVTDLDYDQGHRILRLVRKGAKRAKAPLTPPVLRSLELYLGDRTAGAMFITRTGERLDRVSAYRIVRRLARRAGIASWASSVPTACATASQPRRSTPVWRCAMCKTRWAMPIRARRVVTMERVIVLIATLHTRWRRSSLATRESLSRSGGIPPVWTTVVE